MKRTFISILLLGLVSFVSGQVTLNCESGNRAIEQGNCWAFGSVSYTNTASLVISGSWSARSNQLTNLSPGACWVKTPWMLVGSGEITFKGKFDNSTGTSKGIQLYYIPYNASNPPYYEGTPVLFYDYAFSLPLPVATIQNITAPIPQEIANSQQAYKIRVSMIGSGGNSRLITDDYVFPGTYWSDPANGCIPIVVSQDADGDGVVDAEDAYPNDPNRAYNSYYPSENQTGTLAFEDLWPGQGDYDFNDMVVDYRMKTVTNAANNVVELFGQFTLRAAGASFHNGFGFQLDGIQPDKIQSVSGNFLSDASIYSIAANGLENGQAYATCIVFDDFYKVMTWPGSGIGINTDKDALTVPYETLNVHLVFIDNGVPASGGTVSNLELTPSKFNFFIVAKQDRGKEIHLADRIPTSLVNTELFGTKNDDSNPAQGKYYKTKNNLPWGINVLQGFDYPVEKAPINEAYLHFIEWAVSGGVAYPSWFSNESGYRDNSKIY